jgi:hypothetical protein
MSGQPQYKRFYHTWYVILIDGFTTYMSEAYYAETSTPAPIQPRKGTIDQFKGDYIKFGEECPAITMTIPLDHITVVAPFDQQM